MIECAIDTSCWYITQPCKENGYRPVENEAGEPVKLNTRQTKEDMEIWHGLHLKQQYHEVWPMLYECIVFGHNLRHGYIHDPIPKDMTEAVYIVRMEFNRGLNTLKR